MPRDHRNRTLTPGGSGKVTRTVDMARIIEDIEDPEFNVPFTRSAYDPGRTSGPPEDCYPPEGGETEVDEVAVFNRDFVMGQWFAKVMQEVLKGENMTTWEKACINADVEEDESWDV